jgi:hypothetical protein
LAKANGNLKEVFFAKREILSNQITITAMNMNTITATARQRA